MSNYSQGMEFLIIAVASKKGRNSRQEEATERMPKKISYKPYKMIYLIPTLSLDKAYVS